MEMDKPISILLRETRNNIIDVLNNSNLQIDILTFIVRDILSDLQLQAEQEYIAAINNMNTQSINEQTEQDEQTND